MPFKPVLQKLADLTGVSRNYLTDYLFYMERAGMISQLRDDTGGVRSLGKVEKIYLDNTNLIYVLGQENTNVGNVRETFFMNQMRVKHDVVSSRQADFRIGDYTFEIGGRGKGQQQIRNVEQSFVVKDDIESGYGNVIPLWAFGLNY